MTENSKENQNEIDAEQAFKDFLKELVLSPLENQQKTFLPALKKTVQDSISESEDISGIKNSVSDINKLAKETKDLVESLSNKLDRIEFKSYRWNLFFKIAPIVLLLLIIIILII